MNLWDLGARMDADKRSKYDTRPLFRQELIGAELTLLGRLVGHVRDVLDEVEKAPERRGGATGHPWAVIDTRRTPRAVMLDGERGTGKTSLMLTFLRGIDLAHARTDLPPPSSGTGPWCEDPGVLKRIRVLPIADLHPMPEKMPIYAWLMQGFLGAAELVGRDAGGRGGRRPGAEVPESLAMRLKQIQQAAVVAWDGARGPTGRSQDEWLLNESAQITEWALLEARWQGWLSDLLDELQRTGSLGAHDVLILPIDDLDLYNRHGRDLLLALRRLYHPRLVFLLNGDYDHLVEVVAQAYRRDIGLGAEPEIARQDKAMVLARALAEKVIPASMRLQVTLPGVTDLLDKMEGWREIFQAVKIGAFPRLSDDALNIQSLEDALRLYAQDLPDLDACTRFRFRPLSQLLDRLRAEPPTFRTVIDGLQGALTRPNGNDGPLHAFTMMAVPPRSIQMTHAFKGFELHSYVAEDLAVHGLTAEGRKVDLPDTNLTLLDLIEADAGLFASPFRTSEKLCPYQLNPVDGTVRTILRVEGFPGVDIPAWRSLDVYAPLGRIWFHRAIKAIELRIPAGRTKWTELAQRYLELMRLIHEEVQPSTMALPGEVYVPPDPLRSDADPSNGQQGNPTLGPRLNIVFHEQIEYGPSMCTPEGGWLPDEAGRLMHTLMGSGQSAQRRLEEEEQRRLYVIQRALGENRAANATTMLARMREGAPLHPWHVLPLRLAHGNGRWWLKLQVATPQPGVQTSLDAGLLDRGYRRASYVSGKWGPVGELSALFYLGSSQSGRAFPHAVTFAIGEWLLAREGEAQLLLGLANRVSTSRSREGTGILLRELFLWVYHAPNRLPEQDPDDKALKARALRLRSHMVDGLQIAVAPNGETLTFGLSSAPSWKRVGAPSQFNEFGDTLSVRFEERPWVLTSEQSEDSRMILEEGVQPGWLSTWASVLRATTGVLQSYHCDIHGTAYGETLTDPVIQIRGESPFPVPPFHAWIDHEVLSTVMNWAWRFARGIDAFEGAGLRHPGALSRWALILYARVCCDLLDGYRSGHINAATQTFSVSYPLSDTNVISQAAEQLNRIIRSATREDIRTWAFELDRLMRLGLDDEARAAWIEGYAKAAPAPPSKE